MNKRLLMVSIGLAALGLSACGKQEEPVKEAAAPAPAEQPSMVDKAADAASAAMERSEEMADAAIIQAEDWIDEARSYLEEGKTELAAAIMAKLRAVKDSLPENIQAEIDKLEAMF